MQGLFTMTKLMGNLCIIVGQHVAITITETTVVFYKQCIHHTFPWCTLTYRKILMAHHLLQNYSLQWVIAILKSTWLSFFSEPTQLLYRTDSIAWTEPTWFFFFFTEPIQLIYFTELTWYFTEPSQFFKLARCAPTAGYKRTRARLLRM